MPRTLLSLCLFFFLTCVCAKADTISLNIGFSAPEPILNYIIPAGQSITGVNVSGAYFASPDIPLGSPFMFASVGLNIEGFTVASNTVRQGGPLVASGSFSFDFPSSSFALFSDGNAAVRLLSFMFVNYSGGATLTITTGPTPVPEPMTIILLATGLAGISTRQWRKRVRP